MNNLLQGNSLARFERLNTLIEDMFPTPSILKSMWNPAVDITETETEYLVKAELPGLHRENIEVEFAGGALVIRGTREETSTASGEDFIRRERHSGSFYRSFRIDLPIKQNEIEADYQNGLLTVRMPKAKPLVEAHRIDVK